MLRMTPLCHEGNESSGAIPLGEGWLKAGVGCLSMLERFAHLGHL